MNTKIKTLIILSLVINFPCHSQSEPEKLNGQDMIDKVDRSDIEAQPLGDPIEFNTNLPKMKLEKIEFNKPDKDNKKTKAQSSNTATKKLDKSVTANNVVKEVKESKATTNVERKIEDKPIETTKTSVKKKTVLVSKRKVSISNLLINDVVVENEVATYIYRKVKSNTVQFKYIGKMPFYSLGLEVLASKKYKVVDLSTLKTDSKSSKDPYSKRLDAVNVPEVKNTTQIKEANKISSENTENLINIDELKKEVEALLNKGNKITNTMETKNLIKRDIIHVTEAGDLLERKTRASVDSKFYWLTEKINTERASLKKVSNNKYKVIKHRYDQKY